MYLIDNEELSEYGIVMPLSDEAVAEFAEECINDDFCKVFNEGSIRNGPKYPQSSKCILQVRSRDNGPLPHFHVKVQGTDDPMFHGALLLDENRDFNHNENKMRMDFSKKKFAKELDTFLRQTNQQTGKSNWNTLQDDWNKNNVRVRTSKTKYQPDYTHIERYRK